MSAGILNCVALDRLEDEEEVENWEFCVSQKFRHEALHLKQSLYVSKIVVVQKVTLILFITLTFHFTPFYSYVEGMSLPHYYGSYYQNHIDMCIEIGLHLCI